MFKKILHPTDFSDVALQAFDQAVALAMLYGAELQLLHAVVLHEYDKSVVEKGMQKINEAYTSLRSELKNQMEEMVKQSDIDDDVCSLTIKRGFGAGEVILEQAEESGADLIVIGTHGHSPIRHFFLGSVAEKVVRYASCPVMVLGRMEDAPGHFENILVPVDFSETSQRSAEIAIELAKKHKARLHLLHIYQNVVPPVYYEYSDEPFKWDPDLRQRGEQALEDFISEEHTQNLEVMYHLREGRLARTIIDLANQESIDLIVMGTAGLTGVHHFLLGSVTEKVLRRADVPVLTVRATKEESSALL